MGMCNSLYAPESDQDAGKTSQEPQQALSDTVKTTRRRRLVELIANRFRSSPSDKSGHLTKKLAVEGDVEGGTQAVPTQPREDAAMGAPPIDKAVEDHVAEAEAQVVPEQPKQHEPMDASPIDKVVEDHVAKAEAQVVPEQPIQHELTDASPTESVVEDHVTEAEAQVVLEQPKQHEATGAPPTEQLEATEAPPTDRIVDGDVVTDEAQVVSEQPKQDDAKVVAKEPKPGGAVDTPPIDAVLDVPEDFLRDLRAVLEKGQVSQGTPLELTKELEGKLASYSEKKVEEYDVLRQQGTLHEASLGFDFACTTKASKAEIDANKVLQELKENDIERFYAKAGERDGYAGQKHKRYYGDHFLSNVDIIEQTQLFALCRAMPKGAHLHIHFNANLLPSVLLDIAKNMDRMFIWSSTSLHQREAFDSCKLQFSIMNEAAVEERGAGNLFDPKYKEGHVMQFKQFLESYPDGAKAALNWLQSKLVFQEEEAHNVFQTQEGAWEKFNARTQMMKGLFNYETAYREYTRQCLEEFDADNIHYAEIRPNFMSSNQVWKDDGSSRIDNVGIMELIIDVYEKFKEDKNRENKVLMGLKVIYCTPRSFTEEQVRDALMQCFQFKKDERFSEYIAGFDLVGEEGQPKPLKYFRKQFLQFQALCKAANVEIPFLFHCGETLDIGTDTDGNLMDALLLGAKRIGHGFALPRHPYVMAKMKERNVCVEVCPISNEILGLTPRISGHSVYNLLANNVPCTISTDNGTFFRSRLSHDFYQIIAGKSDMTLHGLRQLIEWSIQHSCMEPKLMEEVRQSWEQKWKEFCEWIIKKDFTTKPASMKAQTDLETNKPPGGSPPV